MAEQWRPGINRQGCGWGGEFGDTDGPERGESQFVSRPLLRSVVITVLAALIFPLTFIIDFKQRVGSSVDDWVTVRLIDVAFRMALGAILVLVLVPLVLGVRRERGWMGRYLTAIRVGPGDPPRRALGATVLASLALVVVIIGLTIGSGVFDNDLGVLVRDDQWVIFLLALVPGIWEELTFRGAILTSLQQRYTPRAAVLVSAVLFGLFHLSNFWGSDDTAAVIAGVVAATFLGIGWGHLVVATGSVIPAMFLHYAVDVLLDAEVFIDPLASDDAVTPVYLGIVVLWPVLTIVIARIRFGDPPSLT